MKPIRINGRDYPSIAAAWRDVSPDGLSQFTVRWRLKNGWDTEMALIFPPVLPEERRKFADVRRTFAEDGDKV